MNIRINKNYICFAIITLLLLIDSFFLCLIKEDTILYTLYIIANLLIIVPICLKKDAESCIIISLLFMLFYSFFIDVYIHYLGYKVFLEAEFIFLIPLFIGCLKTKSQKKNGVSLLFVGSIYIILNAIVLIIVGKVEYVNYFTFMVNIVSFIGFYHVINNNNISKKLIDLYKYIFIICLPLTILQTRLGFSEDTRNGVFSVFGWGAYTFFIMLLFLYDFKRFINKEIKLAHFLITLVICVVLFICTESKAALVIMFISIIIITLVNKGVSFKKIFILGCAFMLIPVAYKLLLKFNPKFTYLNNFSVILRYYTGNNNWRYEYGRFEALNNVYTSLTPTAQIFGIGFGSSTPLYNVFYTELNRNIAYPYYITKYGYYYGFQHTSSSTILLDGGLILFTIVIAFLLRKIYSSVRKIKNEPKNVIGFLQLGILVYLIYYFTYSNMLKDFRAMSIIAIILGLNQFKLNIGNKTEQGDKEIDDKNNNSI